MKLEDIGFYTMSDSRAAQTSSKSPLQRCELILTDACTFRCVYCRGLKQEYAGTISKDAALRVLDYWISEGLVNVRFSGGEPTLHKHLSYLATHCKNAGVKRIAVSSNGAASQERYEELLACGVNDFSISLDACCASTGDTMAGVKGQWQKVIDNIAFLSANTYVTVGVVLTETNIGEASKTVQLASGLGVSDIRIIPAAQWRPDIKLEVDQNLLDKHPILKYKVNHLNSGGKARGLDSCDSNRCALVLDDMAVARDLHFPCIIALREGSKPIGKIGPNCRAEREQWFREHDTHADPICKKNCLDFCVMYNNKYRDLNAK